MRRTIITSSIAISLLFGSSIASAEPTFTDLKSTHWAYKSVAGLAAKNVISGYQDGSYKPDSTITRAELAVILTKVAGLEATPITKSSYSDVKVTDWFAPYVEAVRNYMGAYVSKETGAVVYAPDRATTREEIASAIVMAKGFKQKDVKVLDSYHDTRDIAASRLNLLAAAVENNIISGYDDKTIRPKSSVTRAEAAVIIWRAFGEAEQLAAESPKLEQEQTIVNRMLGYWLDPETDTYYKYERIDEKSIQFNSCSLGEEMEFNAKVKSDTANSAELQLVGYGIDNTYVFDSEGNLVMDHSTGSVSGYKQRFQPSSSEAYQTCKVASFDTASLESFSGKWAPKGNGEGGRVYIEFRDRYSGVIEFQAEAERTNYIFGVKKINGNEIVVEYAESYDSELHSLKLILFSPNHLTLEFDNGVINEFERQ